jgi:hypothetical protein
VFIRADTVVMVITFYKIKIFRKFKLLRWTLVWAIDLPNFLKICSKLRRQKVALFAEKFPELFKFFLFFTF